MPSCGDIVTLQPKVVSMSQVLVQCSSCKKLHIYLENKIIWQKVEWHIAVMTKTTNHRCLEFQLYVCFQGWYYFPCIMLLLFFFTAINCQLSFFVLFCLLRCLNSSSFFTWVWCWEASSWCEIHNPNNKGVSSCVWLESPEDKPVHPTGELYAFHMK